MPFQWHSVPSFGGGLNLAADPLSIQDDQWSMCHAFFPQHDQAQSAGALRKLATGAQWWPNTSSFLPIGWVPDLIRLDYPGILAFYANNPVSTSSSVYCKRIYWDWTQTTPPALPPPQVVTIPQSGSGRLNADQYVYMPPPMHTCVVGAQQLILFGIPGPGAGDTGAAKWVGDNQLYLLQNVKARHACSASGHAIIAEVDTDYTNARTVKISDAGIISTWTPDISNSADYFTVDGGDRITGLVGVSGGFIVLMERTLQVAQSTRQIPPFAIDAMQSRGSMGQGALGVTGAVYMTSAGLANASGQMLAPQIANYAVAFEGLHVVRDQAHDAVLITNGLRSEFLGVNLRTDRAWRHQLPFNVFPGVPWNGPLVRHGAIVVRDPVNRAGEYSPLWIMHMVMDLNSGDVYGQWDDSVPETNAYLDTKDFAFGSSGQPVNNVTGAMVSYVDRLKVQWESTATGALDVWVAVRNHLSRQAGTALPWQEDTAQTLTWTKVGTLTAGLSELPLRLKGKFYRFRFAVSNGQPIRIRSFAIRNLPTSDLRAAA
jgi:hypothetical protein